MIKDTDKSAHGIGFNAETLVKGGGCAFPFVIELDDNKSMAYSHGMTLRDYFAAKAMQALITSRHTDYENGWYAEDALASSSYNMAEAMLAERNK